MVANYRTPNNKRIRVNEQIRSPQLRLIGENGEQLGIVTAQDGLRMAQEAGLDLVEVAPDGAPPVCRIMDLGKYLYALSKKEKEAKKKQKVIDVKEIKMTSKIEDHDYQTKLRNARRFIQRGDKVKLTLFYRGREITHMELGQRIIDRFIQDISEDAEVERNDGLEGNAYHVYFMTKTSQSKKSPSPAKSEGNKDVSDAKNQDE